VEPRVTALARMALAPDVDETLRGDAVVQLGPGARVRLFGAQPRIGVETRARDVPVAGHDDAAVLSKLAAEIHHARLEAALQRMPVSRDAPGLVIVRFRRAVHRVDVHDREPALAHDDDAALEVPLRHLRAPDAADVARDAVHAPASKRDVACIARE